MLPTMGPHGVSNMNALAGKAVQADDVIRFKLAAVEDELGKPLETTKAVLIKDGMELCTAGFLGRKTTASTSTSKFAQVVLEMCDENENSMMRKKSKRNARMASFHLMEDIQGQEYICCSSPQPIII